MSEIISDILKRQGWQEGWNQGLEQGMEKGLEQGMEKGLLRGWESGKLTEGRDLLLLLLPKKLGAIPLAIEKKLREVDDLELINDLLVRVLELRDWNEVEQLLQ